MTTQLNIDSNLIERFSKKFTIGEGCWNWITESDYEGYPKFNLGEGKKLDAHKVSYQIFKGDIPDSMRVMHLCSNKKCMNPSHLQLATRSEIQKQTIRKGKTTVPRPPQTKLNEDKVRVIKAELRAGRTPASLAKEYGVCKKTIGDIANNVSWKNIA
jgi:hypothetical protein